MEPLDVKVLPVHRAAHDESAVAPPPRKIAPRLAALRSMPTSRSMGDLHNRVRVVAARDARTLSEIMSRARTRKRRSITAIDERTPSARNLRLRRIVDRRNERRGKSLEVRRSSPRPGMRAEMFRPPSFQKTAASAFAVERIRRRSSSRRSRSTSDLWDIVRASNLRLEREERAKTTHLVKGAVVSSDSDSDSSSSSSSSEISLDDTDYEDGDENEDGNDDVSDHGKKKGPSSPSRPRISSDTSEPWNELQLATSTEDIPVATEEEKETSAGDMAAAAGEELIVYVSVPAGVEAGASFLAKLPHSEVCVKVEVPLGVAEGDTIGVRVAPELVRHAREEQATHMRRTASHHIERLAALKTMKVGPPAATTNTELIEVFGDDTYDGRKDILIPGVQIRELALKQFNGVSTKMHSCFSKLDLNGHSVRSQVDEARTGLANVKQLAGMAQKQLYPGTLRSLRRDLLQVLADKEKHLEESLAEVEPKLQAALADAENTKAYGRELRHAAREGVFAISGPLELDTAAAEAVRKYFEENHFAREPPLVVTLARPNLFPAATATAALKTEANAAKEPIEVDERATIELVTDVESLKAKVLNELVGHGVSEATAKKSLHYIGWLYRDETSMFAENVAYLCQKDVFGSFVISNRHADHHLEFSYPAGLHEEGSALAQPQLAWASPITMTMYGKLCKVPGAGSKPNTSAEGDSGGTPTVAGPDSMRSKDGKADDIMVCAAVLQSTTSMIYQVYNIRPPHVDLTEDGHGFYPFEVSVTSTLTLHSEDSAPILRRVSSVVSHAARHNNGQRANRSTTKDRFARFFGRNKKRSQTKRTNTSVSSKATRSDSRWKSDQNPLKDQQLVGGVAGVEDLLMAGGSGGNRERNRSPSPTHMLMTEDAAAEGATRTRTEPLRFAPRQRKSNTFAGRRGSKNKKGMSKNRGMSFVRRTSASPTRSSFKRFNATASTTMMMQEMI